MTAGVITDRRFVTGVGYFIYIAVLSAGYYYNLTFVQLGMIDLGTRLVGMSRSDVSMVMAGMAVSALVVAVVTGVVMDRRGWSSELRTKFRLLFAVIALQTALTVLAPLVATPAQFVVWVMVCSITIGAGIPVTFSLMIDFIPIRHRGHVAAAVAGLAFFAAALYPLEWRIEEFAVVMVWAMVPAVAVLGLVSFRRFAFVDQLARQYQRFGVGRFCRPVPIRTASFTFWALVAVMFAVFFIDSLGFLRIVDTAAYISTSWQSPDVGTRLFIGVSHLVGAVMAGVLYMSLGRRWLMFAVLGLFAFTHLLYTSHLVTAPGGIDPPLVLPLFYVLAVSFYTTLNFALWPDLSTPANIGTHTALGVGIAGWLASFLSTALALYSHGAGWSLLTHLRYVNALALLLAVSLPVALYLRRWKTLVVVGDPR
ncbi:MAG TPA: MFS transporter [Acidimicrobiia bacterium]|nr:MFS transporter [Acidimicrobiia bacterium]